MVHTVPPPSRARFTKATERRAGEIAAMLRLAPLDEFEQACGALPINGMIEVARRRGLRPSLLDLRNSGDTASDRSRVVGYAALAFAEPLRGDMNRG